MLVYSLATSCALEATLPCHQQTISSVSWHPRLPVVSTGAGQREFPVPSLAGEQIVHQNTAGTVSP